MTKIILHKQKRIPPIPETLDFCVLQEVAGVKKFNDGQRQQMLTFVNSYHRISTVWTRARGAGEDHGLPGLHKAIVSAIPVKKRRKKTSSA